MRKEFAKIFNHPDIGQVLVQRSYDDEDERPVLISIFWYPEANGYATVTCGYENTADGQAILNKVFDEYTEQKAIEQVNRFRESLRGKA